MPPKFIGIHSLDCSASHGVCPAGKTIGSELPNIFMFLRIAAPHRKGYDPGGTRNCNAMS
ncbi:uncharacterized protein METZ01_LOCUS483059 [marine metagenome]|uniref:Uncharacterized protein n=1 Tax=marine metagenome TaxID=408172 RepID=A0A383CET1_9ZZZZ